MLTPTLMSLLVALIPLISAINVLRKLDAAAKQRRLPFSVWTVDLMCLTFLVQIPFSGCINLEFDLATHWPIAATLSAVLTLVWYKTVDTVSSAGINTFGWRSAISLFVIPMTFVGSFVLAAFIIQCGVHIGNGGRVSWNNMMLPTLALVGLLFGLWLSNTIVRQSLLATAANVRSDEIVDAQLLQR